MKTVHVSQFYACTKVSLSVELQYLVELGKYLWSNDCCLSVDGVDFDKVLRKSKYWDYFRVAVDEGWVVDCSESDVEITTSSPVDYSVEFKNVLLVEEYTGFNSKDSHLRHVNMSYAYRTPLHQQIVFSEKTKQYWSWKLDADYIVNNITMNSAGSNTVWVSMLAYVAVQRLLFGYPQNLLLEIAFPITKTPMVLSNFILFMEECSACQGWCFYTFTENVPESIINHLGYTAWYTKGVELGELSHWYSPAEKQEYLKQLDLTVGDVVYLYERKKGQKLDFIKEIAGFHVAIIRKIDSKGISFTIVNNKKTLEQGVVDYASFSMATKQMYDFTNPFETANTTETTYYWSDLGIEYAMHDEHYFITKCTNDDIKEIHVGGGNWSRLLLRLPAIELTYWILKDYKIPFDEERYVSKYMSAEPLYAMYHRLGTVDERYIKKTKR
jgi:hypothetical protein